jgi:hypothetical protein
VIDVLKDCLLFLFPVVVSGNMTLSVQLFLYVDVSLPVLQIEAYKVTGMLDNGKSSSAR